MTEQSEQPKQVDLDAVQRRFNYMVSDLSAQLANKAQELASARLENSELVAHINSLRQNDKESAPTPGEVVNLMPVEADDDLDGELPAPV